MTRYSLRINGSTRDVEAGPNDTLLSVLRDRLDLTGTKYGCGEGQCGACTVLIDGQAVRSCQSRVGLVATKRITTIEGLAEGSKLHPLQDAFLKTEAMQCGYCTPGMIMAAVGLLRRTPDPSDAEIVRQMDRNVCRCGTYPRIVAAIKLASAAMKRGGGADKIAAESKQVITSRAEASGARRGSAWGWGPTRRETWGPTRSERGGGR
jgi:aerobic-type carbon monoxide dehydrogenase small subunit (CoxS/CutS family)